MKNKILKMTILVVLSTMFLFASCKNGEDVNKGDDNNTSKAASTEKIFTVEGTDLAATVGEFEFVLNIVETQLSRGDAEFDWTKPAPSGKAFHEMVKPDALKELERIYVLKAVAKKNNIELSEDDKKNRDDLIEQNKKNTPEDFYNDKRFTADDFESVMNGAFIAGVVERETMKDFKVDEAKLEETMLSIPEYKKLKELGEEEFFKAATVRHILISTKDEKGNDMSEEDKAKAKAKADEVLAMVEKGDKTFEELVEEYSADPGKVQNKGKYEFLKGEMVPAFEKAGFTMEDGETKVVESKFGYHVINKISLKDASDAKKEEVNNRINAYKARISESMKASEFAKKYEEEYKTANKIKLNEDVFNKIKTTYERQKK